MQLSINAMIGPALESLKEQRLQELKPLVQDMQVPVSDNQIQNLKAQILQDLRPVLVQDMQLQMQAMQHALREETKSLLQNECKKCHDDVQAMFVTDRTEPSSTVQPKLTERMYDMECKVESMDEYLATLLDELTAKVDTLHDQWNEWWDGSEPLVDTPVMEGISSPPTTEPIANATLPTSTPMGPPTVNGLFATPVLTNIAHPDGVSMTLPAQKRTCSTTTANSATDTQTLLMDAPVPNYLQKRRGATAPTASVHCPQSAANTVMEDMQLRTLYASTLPGQYPNALLDASLMSRLNAHNRFPTWDGRPETWKGFARDWETACRINAVTMQNPTVKTIAFIECMPQKYQAMFKTSWADAHWGFDDMWAHILDYVGRNISCVQEIRAWENLKPKGRSLEEYLDWYRDFIKAGNDLKDGVITEWNWMTTYKKGLMWKSFFEREFIKLKEQEDKDGRDWDLLECHNWLVKELKRKTHVQQYKSLFEDKVEKPTYVPRQYDRNHIRTVGPTSQCTHCKRTGHLVNQCWFLHPELRPTSTTSPAAQPKPFGGRGGSQPATLPSKPFNLAPSATSSKVVQNKKNDAGKGKGKGAKGKGKGRGKGGEKVGKGASGKGPSRSVREVDVTHPLSQ